jgi:hypothetical protein
MRWRLEGLEKGVAVENRRLGGQELIVFQLAVPSCSELNPRPNWAKAVLFHVERLSVLAQPSERFHVEQGRAALSDILFHQDRKSRQDRFRLASDQTSSPAGGQAPRPDSIR